jgi:hypothetical protein
MDENLIRELIMKRQSDQSISCETAMEVAEEAGVPTSTIGSLLDEMGIKIHSCQLGCFGGTKAEEKM